MGDIRDLKCPSSFSKRFNTHLVLITRHHTSIVFSFDASASSDNISSVKDYHIESIEMHNLLHKRLLSTGSRYISVFLWPYSCIEKPSYVLTIHDMSISNRERGVDDGIRTSTCNNHIHTVAIKMHNVLEKRVRSIERRCFVLFLWPYF
jgi:hypothetical protein